MHPSKEGAEIFDFFDFLRFVSSRLKAVSFETLECDSRIYLLGMHAIPAQRSHKPRCYRKLEVGWLCCSRCCAHGI